MRDKIESVQEFGRWKSHATRVVAGCNIRSAKATFASEMRGKNPWVGILVDSTAGTWRIRRNKAELFAFSQSLDKAFPIEAGTKGYSQSLPNLHLTFIGLRFWKSDTERSERLKALVSKYFRKLLFLPPYISRSRCVLDFLLPWSDRDFPTIQVSDSEKDQENSSRPRSTLFLQQRSRSISRFSNNISVCPSIYPRLKAQRDDEVVAVDLHSEIDYNMLISDICTKFSLSSSDIHLSYIDEAGDIIDVSDDEDFIASIMQGHYRLIVNTK